MSRSKREFHPTVVRHRIPLTEDEKRMRRSLEVPKVDYSRPFETRYTMNHDEHIEANARYGPFSKTIQRLFPGKSQRSFYDVSTWQRSKTKRCKTPNPYSHTMGRILTYSPASHSPDAINGGAGYMAATGRSGADTLASNQARSRFVTELRDNRTAALAVTLAEWGQSQKMIVHRALQISDALRALRRGNFTGFAKSLGLDPVSNDKKTRNSRERRYEYHRSLDSRKIAKQSANLWLEYHFGWSPLVNDIQEAVKVLASNPPAITVRGKGKYHEMIQSAGVPQPYAWWIKADYTARVLVQAECYVSNPNLALANQLGLINPAVVAWELVPFSFLVDWFIPVGKFLDSWTDQLGYNIQYPFTTTTRKVSHYEIYRQDSGPNQDTSTGWYHSRVLGIPAYSLKALPFKGFSVARGATAISLVIQQFLSIGKK